MDMREKRSSGDKVSRKARNNEGKIDGETR